MILSEDSSSDLFGLFCGAELGRGQYRTVWQHQLEKGKVVKHDTCENWSNVHEHSLFRECQGTALEKWLAPVYWLSPRGLWLIQAKTTPVPESRLPKKVPTLFCDLKPENWGLWRGKVVCHDYGNNSVYRIGVTGGSSMKTAQWRL